LASSLAFSNWLLWQATFNYIALIPLALLSVWCLWRIQTLPGVVFILGECPKFCVSAAVGHVSLSAS